jgi:hypothetical protein
MTVEQIQQKIAEVMAQVEVLQQKLADMHAAGMH